MTTEKQTGRRVGALLLAAMLLGIWNDFGLTDPIFGGDGYLQNGSKMPQLFGASVLLSLLTNAMGLAVAIIGLPVLRQYTPSLALAFVLMTTIGFATSIVEQGNFLSMQSLSLLYAKTPGVDPALFEILRGTVAADRNWIHFLDKILSGGSILLLHLALFRAGLIPRFLSAFGVVAALTQMGGISIELFSLDLPMLMLAPLGLAQFALCFTLLARGFVQSGKSAGYAAPVHASL